MVGLDAAGKTTILYKLKLGNWSQPFRLLDSMWRQLNIKEFASPWWDVGGQDKIRPLWRHYYHNTQGIIFVVDSNDRERIPLARTSFIKCLWRTNFTMLSSWCSQNKQDIPGALSAADLIKGLELGSVEGSRKWHVQPTIATSGEGLYEGLCWLKDTLEAKKN